MYTSGEADRSGPSLTHIRLMSDASPGRNPDRFSSRAPISILLLCLAVLGVGIYSKAARAIAPPIFDSAAYYAKGALVWREWSSHHLANPLNVPPTSRPPGTMLVTSPFGFSPDFRPYLFRSTYIPVIVFVMAFWVLAESQLRRPGQRWANLVGALMLAGFPMFYQFERNPAFTFSSEWGHVDCLLGAMAALAVALLIVSAKRLSLALAAMGALIGAFTLLIKPAGLILIPIFCFLWATELIAVNWPVLTEWRQNPPLRGYALRAGCLFVIFFGAVTAASLGSEYLSRTNLELGYTAQKIVIDMSKNTPLWKVIAPQIQASLGWHWFCGAIASTLFLLGRIVATSSLWQKSLAGRSPASQSFESLTANGGAGPQPAIFGTERDFRFLAALVSLGVGIVWWVVLAGPAQIRYVYPFWMIFVVIMLPDLLEAADSALPRWARWTLAMACVAPVGFIAVLLFMGTPPIEAQLLAGVNLSTGQFKQEVRLGDFLTDQASRQGRNLTLYDFVSDQRSAVVEAELSYSSLLHPERPTIQTFHENDWVRPILIRRAEMVQADLLLFDPVRDARRLRALIAQPAIADSTAGSEVISAWLTRTSDEQGLSVVSDVASNDGMRLVRVIDHVKLDHAFGQLEAQRRYEGHLDHAGCDAIAGWAWNQGAPDVPLEVHLLSDGNPLITLTARILRPDLKTAGKGNGAHAFEWETPASLKDGRGHTITATTGDPQIELLESPQRVTCR